MKVLPPRSVLLGILGRAVLLWALLKVVFGFFIGFGAFTGAASGVLILGVVGLALLDLRTFKERVFLANLGVSRRTVAAITALVAIPLEILVTVLLASSTGAA